MSALRIADRPPIPHAPVGELAQDRDGDEREWERRVMDAASWRLEAAAARIERLGIIDSGGRIASRELLADMKPDSEPTLETR